MGSNYYDREYDDYPEADELDIRFSRGRVSPSATILYPERHHPRTVPRPAYYGGPYLAPELGGGSVRRSRSHSGSARSHASSPPAPVIINKIYNENYDSDDEDRYSAQLAPPRYGQSRSRSASRHANSPPAQPSSAYYSREDWERDERMDQTYRELERYKLREEQEKKERMLQKEMELQKLKEEKRAEEEKERVKRERALAVEKYKVEELEKAAKAKKEREERDREYQKRLTHDLRRMGLDERQTTQMSMKDAKIDPSRPTYTRMARRYLSIETLNAFGMDYQFDTDPEYVLIKRVVPQWEQDRLWQHTKQIREVHESRQQPMIVAIEDRKEHHHHKRHEPELEFVRKKHERKSSPSPLLAWVAGGRP